MRSKTSNQKMKWMENTSVKIETQNLKLHWVTQVRVVIGYHESLGIWKGSIDRINT